MGALRDNTQILPNGASSSNHSKYTFASPSVSSHQEEAEKCLLESDDGKEPMLPNFNPVTSMIKGYVSREE